MKPNFIGLGGQKCASTWLYEVLRDHPDVYVSTPKEIDFFSSCYENGSQWYERSFAAAHGKRAVGEISPSYLPDCDAPARACEYNPAFRLVVSLRDPVERAYSNHLHEIRLGHYAGEDLSFEAGLANNPMYLEQSRYAKHLARWLRYFPRGQLLVVLQEEIASYPDREARRLYEFLGIDAQHVPASVAARSNDSYLPRSRSGERLIRAVGNATRSLGLSRLVELMRRAGLIAAIHRGSRLQIREIVPPMRSSTREDLYRLFGNECIELAGMIGRESLPWKTWESAVSRRSPHALCTPQP
jgi:hypothetical protein